MRLRNFSVVVACTALGACATSSQQGRAQLVVPLELGALYSEVGMRVKLAAASVSGAERGTEMACPPEGCTGDREFGLRVSELGERLASSAYRLFPELGARAPEFEFSVAAKAEAGTVSNSAGAIIVLAGVRDLELGDEALSFLIAREMGHVIGRHHEEDSATSIIVSVVTALLLPVANFLQGTAASFAGSSMVRAAYREDQMREADAIGLQLLAERGGELHDVAWGLARHAARPGDDQWSKDLGASSRRLGQLAWGPPQRLRAVPPEATASLRAVPVE